jgi:hypothetical protein
MIIICKSDCVACSDCEGLAHPAQSRNAHFESVCIDRNVFAGLDLRDVSAAIPRTGRVNSYDQYNPPNRYDRLLFRRAGRRARVD